MNHPGAVGQDQTSSVRRPARLGQGWSQIAAAVAEAMPVDEIDRIWLFPPLRSEGREWGTAVIARAVGTDRRTVYTATYLVVVRGRRRGQARVTLEEVGSSPPEVVDDVVAGVRERAGEMELPVEIVAAEWFGPGADAAVADPPDGPDPAADG